MSRTQRNRNLFIKVTDGYNWVHENGRAHMPIKTKRVDWLAKSLYCRLTMHRDDPLRDKQIRQNRRINKLICRGLSREKIFPNWKVGYF